MRSRSVRFPAPIDPGTRSFREFPAFAETLDPRAHNDGSRCSAPAVSAAKKRAHMLLERGFDEVYQLDGGILEYLESAGADNRFSGECFVFDQRVSVAMTTSRKATTRSCHACRACADGSRHRIVGLCASTSAVRIASARTPSDNARRSPNARGRRGSPRARGERHVGAIMNERSPADNADGHVFAARKGRAAVRRIDRNRPAPRRHARPPPARE